MKKPAWEMDYRSKANPKRKPYKTHTGVTLVPKEKNRCPPPGCIDVWQISARIGENAWTYYGVFKDFALCVAYAEHIKLTKNPRNVCVNHKAAVELPDGNFHLVHFNPINFKHVDPQVLLNLERQLNGLTSSNQAPSDPSDPAANAGSDERTAYDDRSRPAAGQRGALRVGRFRHPLDCPDEDPDVADVQGPDEPPPY